MMRKLHFLLIMLLSSSVLLAQERIISGTVIEENGEGLPGVNVVVKGTTVGTVTDINGAYSLSIGESGDVLVYSSVGYVSQEINIAGRSLIDITMKEDITALEEIVVIGYGTVKKSDLTGSVGSLSGEKLMAAPVSTLDQGLQGKIAGVTVQQQSGAPGQAMKIRVRGGSSINYSNEPLYVIDGFIGANISTINPNDIASIDILKDASATAIYGSRGANGVVLITTNKPTQGKFKISLDAFAGPVSLINKYELLTPVEQMTLMNEQDVAAGKSPAFSDSYIDEYRNGTREGTDWQDLVTQQGVTQNYTLSANGGTENIQYYISGNYYDDKGVIKNSYYNRFSLRSNLSAKLTEKIDLRFNLYGVHINSQANASGNGGMGNPIGYAVVMPQLWDNRDEDGEIIDPNTYPNFDGTYQVGRDQHPEQRIRQNQESMNDQVISNLDLNFDLGKGFSLLLSGSGSYSGGYSGQRTLEDYISISRDDISARQNYSRNTRWMTTNILAYEKTFGKHYLKVAGIYEYQKGINRGVSATVGELSTLANEWYLLSNGIPAQTSSNYAETSFRSWMGRVNYTFADKYLFTASIRADGVSVFNEDNRWGYFPSAAVAWRVSNESFLSGSNFIDDLKLRVGFGSTGNSAVGPYATLPSLNSTPQANASYYPMYGGVMLTGIRPTAGLTNANLMWETTNQYNIGLDFSIIDGVLSGVLDVYSKQTSDVIIAQSVPRYTGYTSVTDNLADIKNEGIEFSLNWNVMSKNDFEWDLYGNISKNKNTVESLTEGLDQMFIANESHLGIWSLVGGHQKFVVREGESMGSLFGLKYERLWQLGEEDEAAQYKSRPGEPKYEDLDGDGVYSASDRQIIGNTQPKFTYGFGTSLSWKGIDFNVQCVGYYGNQIYNFGRNILTQQARILAPGYRDRWTPENPDATHQTMPVGDDYSMTYVVGQYVEDGTFFKIANMTLGYTLPSSFTDNIKMGSVRFYVSADNLLTITDYSGLDPEASSTPRNSDSQAGIDAFSYPLTRTILGGVKINF